LRFVIFHIISIFIDFFSAGCCGS